MKEQQMNLVLASYKDTPVSFNDNAFLYASDIAKKFGTRVQKYLKSDRTKDYITALLNSKTPNGVSEQNQLVIVKKGGIPENQGTWLHPKLAIDFARFCSADFAVWCDQQIDKILKNQSNPPPKMELGDSISFMEEILLGGNNDDRINALEINLEEMARLLLLEKINRRSLEKKLDKLCAELSTKNPMEYDEFKEIMALKPFHTWDYIAQNHSERSSNELARRFNQFAKENGYN